MQPVWKGPIKDGITQSLLNRFLECRERFRLLAVEGLKDVEEFDHKLEFGNMFHLLLEYQDQGAVKLREYRQKHLYKKFPDSKKEIDRWCQISVDTFDTYRDYWQKDTKAKKIKTVAPEQSFRVPYTLPSGRKITLRGKIDAIVQSGKSYYLQENKCKGWIDEEGIRSTLQENMQAMFYYIACQSICMYCRGTGYMGCGMDNTATACDNCKGKEIVDTGKNKHLSGIYFNVIRRPLSEKYSIVQKKGRIIKGKRPGEKDKRVGAETDKEFLQRLSNLIKENPTNFFYRWKHNITQQGLERFKTECFHPILEQLLDWWEWIIVDPMDPWRERLPSEINLDYYPETKVTASDIIATKILRELDEPIKNTIHYRTPWGMWNSLAGGFRGSYFEYLTKGLGNHLIQTNNLFPELVEL